MIGLKTHLQESKYIPKILGGGLRLSDELSDAGNSIN